MYHTGLWAAIILEHLRQMRGVTWDPLDRSAGTLTSAQSCASLLHPFLRSFDLKVWNMIKDLYGEVPEVVMCSFSRLHVLQLLLSRKMFFWRTYDVTGHV